MKVSVVIVTYNSLKWIEQCIDSIIKSTIEVTIIVVDNKSTDETVSFLKNKYQDIIILIQAPENLGFGKGNNLGIKKAIEQKSDYVFLLNQDTIIEPILIEKLVFAARNNPKYGIISPVHLNYEGNDLEHYFSTYVSINKTPKFLFDHIVEEHTKDIYETNFVNAAAWLIPINVLKKVGGFDPIFWHYGEDDNYGQRVKYHGFKIGIVPKVYIQHDSKERETPKNYIFSRTYYLNYTRYLLIKYGDINKELSPKSYKEERNTILNEVFINFLKLKFSKGLKHYKKISLLKDVFSKIESSREKNVKVVSDFIYLK